MKKAHNPESRLCSPCSGVSYCGMWTNFPISPEIGTAAHFKCVCSALYDFITRGHFPHVGWEEEYLPPVTGMLTELSLRCMETACGQIFGTGTGLGLQHLSCRSPAKSCSQNRRVLTACFTKPEFNKCQSRLHLMDCPAHWWFHVRASGQVRLGGIKRYV